MRCRVSLILFFLSLASLAAQDLTAVRELKQLWKYDEAIASLTQMMAEQGPRPDLLEELADCHYQSGNAVEALSQYSLLAEMQPDKLLYKLRLMNLLYRAKQYEPAIGFGRDILQRDSITQVVSMVGDAFNQLQQRDSAEWYYRRALSRRPHNDAVLSKLCNILLGREQHEEVLALTDAFLAEEPDNLTILPVRGVARYGKQQYDESEADFKRMYELGDDGYAVHYYLGLCAQKTGILRDAIREFGLAWQRDSTDVGVALTLGQLIAETRSSGWEKWFDKALAMLEPDPKVLANAHQNCAISAYKTGAFDRCIAEYNKVLEYNPKHYAAFYMIAQCYEYKKDYKSALSWFKKAQAAFAEGTRGREIADTGIQRMETELFFLNE
jgi:tetratricopeptide (TPR) repeat protein